VVGVGGESEGNLDPTVYAHTPDNQVALSPQGKEEATQAGKKLRDHQG